MAKHRGKDYFCNLVSEDVEITLKNKLFLNLQSKEELFVLCNQSECQYVGVNQYPCPLTINLFADKIERRSEKRRERMLQF